MVDEAGREAANRVPGTAPERRGVRAALCKRCAPFVITHCAWRARVAFHRQRTPGMARAGLPRVKLEDTLPLMLWRAKPDLSCEYTSRAWLEFTGFSEEQAKGDGWSRAVHAEDLARWLDCCVRAFDAREPFEIEYRMRRHDGEYCWVLDRAAPMYSVDGLFLGYVGACVDIHDRKRAEQTLARSLERERKLRTATEEASRAKDGFV